MKLPKRFAHAVFSLLMSALSALLVSGVVMLRIHGTAPDFLPRWINAFLTAWPVIFPVIFFVAPLVRRWTDRLTGLD